MRLLATIIAITAVLLILDAIMLGVVRKDFYRAELTRIQNSPVQFRLPPAVLAYGLMILAVYMLAVQPNQSIQQAGLRGALIGLIVYGIYNMTNYATLQRYSFEYVWTDTLWGTILFALAAMVGQFVYHRVK